MVAEALPRGLGIGQRHATARSVGWHLRPPRALPPAVLGVRIWAIRRRAAPAQKHRQEYHQEHNRHVQQSREIDAADLGLSGHGQNLARDPRAAIDWRELPQTVDVMGLLQPALSVAFT
jgi:hypothetical protein